MRNAKKNNIRGKKNFARRQKRLKRNGLKKKRRQKKHPLRLLLINQLLMKNQRMRNRFQLSTLKSKSQAIQLRKNPPRKNQNQLKRNLKLKLMKVKRNLKKSLRSAKLRLK
jgi:hypothetical protein